MSSSIAQKREMVDWSLRNAVNSNTESFNPQGKPEELNEQPKRLQMIPHKRKPKKLC